jgi:hypothetical protein
MQAVATAKVVKPFYLIDMEFASPVRLWSGLGDLDSPVGSTLNLNSSFTSNLTGWTVQEFGTGTVTHSSGQANISGADFQNRAGVYQEHSTVAGQKYTVTVKHTGADLELRLQDTATSNNFYDERLEAGTKQHTFTALGATTQILIRSRYGGTAAATSFKLNKAETYIGAGDLLKISEIQETSDLQANGASVTLSGVNTALVGLARDQDYQGKRMSVSLGAIDDVANVIVSPVNLFTGFMDVMTINDGGTYSDISVTCENKLIAFEKAYIRRYTDNDQKIEHPTDNGFEYVASIQEKEIVWGKPTPNTASTRPPVDTRGTR